MKIWFPRSRWENNALKSLVEQFQGLEHDKSLSETSETSQETGFLHGEKEPENGFGIQSNENNVQKHRACLDCSSIYRELRPRRETKLSELSKIQPESMQDCGELAKVIVEKVFRER